MRLLGTIQHLQIQRDHLKRGEKPNREYHTDPLLHVPALRLDSGGVIGLAETDIIDVHHVRHPRSRNRENINGVSLNFTGHYVKMRQQYGAHLFDGCAGENILVENDGIFSEADLGDTILIETAGGLVELNGMLAAPPCLEFSCYVQQRRISGVELKTTLQFLDDGTRGFYMRLADESSQPVIRQGDKVYAK